MKRVLFKLQNICCEERPIDCYDPINVSCTISRWLVLVFSFFHFIFSLKFHLEHNFLEQKLLSKFSLQTLKYPFSLCKIYRNSFDHWKNSWLVLIQHKSFHFRYSVTERKLSECEDVGGVRGEKVLNENVTKNGYVYVLLFVVYWLLLDSILCHIDKERTMPAIRYII